jgi:hypothetical protein
MATITADATLTASALIPVAQGPHDDQWPPNNKFMYEEDGTTVTYYTNDVEVAFGPTYTRSMNFMGAGVPNNNSGYDRYKWYFIFPEKRNITHYFIASKQDGWTGGDPTMRMWYSSDTTNGSDGTWTQASVVCPNTSGLAWEQTRNHIQPINLTDIAGLRFYTDHTLSLYGGDGGWYTLVHLYGDKVGASSRIAFWHPTRDEEVPGDYFDWGNFQYGTATKDFRIKNMSPTKRALNTTIRLDSYNDIWNPTWSSLHTLTQGTTESYTAYVSNLASGQISDIITLKRDIPYSITPSYFSLRLTAEPTTWQTYIHNVTVSLTTYNTMASQRSRTQNASAALSASTQITDGTLYRNTGLYRDGKSYRGSRTTQSVAATATLTANAAGDLYLNMYTDAYGNTGIAADAYNPFVKATATLTATVAGDNYKDKFTDEYGNSGLSAVTN